MAAPPVRIRRRNGFGLTALVLGLLGAGLDRFAVAAWFVALPLGLLTLLFASFGLVAARGRLVATGKSALAGSVAGAVTLTLGAWGTAGFVTALNRLTEQVGVAVARPAPAADPAARGAVGWNQPYAFGTGLAVTVAEPTATMPPVLRAPGRGAGGIIAENTENTALRGRRTVVITVTVANLGPVPYRFDGSAFGPTATFDDHPMPALVDPARQLDSPPSTAVPPGGTDTFQVAYALPVGEGDLRLEFRPDPDSGPGIVAGRA